MRKVLLVFAVVVGLVGIPTVAIAASPVASIDQVTAFQGQGPDIKVDINTDRGGAWYTNPVWIAIGVIALIVIVMLIVMASKSGGTTVVRG